MPGGWGSAVSQSALRPGLKDWTKTRLAALGDEAAALRTYELGEAIFA